MKEIKRKILRIFFVCELFAFACMYVYGPHGMQRLWQIEKENTQLMNEVHVLQTDICGLEYKIIQWNTHPFYKEKVAREQLQMARKEEKIYLINT